MTDLFSTDVMLGVLYSLLPTPQFLLDRYFPILQVDEGEEIHFDLIDKTRRLAPFVSPIVEGQIVLSRGYKTFTFKPAYIKDKRPFEYGRPIRRAAGEPIGGGRLTPLQRVQLLLTQDMVDQRGMVDRRLETMAAEALLKGGETIVGDKYPMVYVDFERDPSLTRVLTGASRWNQAGVNPLDDLENWALMVLGKSGAMPLDVIMTVDVWKVFKENPFIKERLDRFRDTETLSLNAVSTEGATAMGAISGFNIFIYVGWYEDANGVQQPIFPNGTVIMASQQLAGVRAFGAIRDEKAGLQAMEYFIKSWVEEDPSVRYTMLQSAPLMVPMRANASLAATVL